MAAFSASWIRAFRSVGKHGEVGPLFGQICVMNLASRLRLRMLWEICLLAACRVRDRSSWEQLQWRWKECPSGGVGWEQNGQALMGLVMSRLW